MFTFIFISVCFVNVLLVAIAAYLFFTLKSRKGSEPSARVAPLSPDVIEWMKQHDTTPYDRPVDSLNVDESIEDDANVTIEPIAPKETKKASRPKAAAVVPTNAPAKPNRSDYADSAAYKKAYDAWWRQCKKAAKDEANVATKPEPKTEVVAPKPEPKAPTAPKTPKTPKAEPKAETKVEALPSKPNRANFADAASYKKAYDAWWRLCRRIEKGGVVAPKAETKTEPKTEPKEAPKAEPKEEPKAEPTKKSDYLGLIMTKVSEGCTLSKEIVATVGKGKWTITKVANEPEGLMFYVNGCKKAEKVSLMYFNLATCAEILNALVKAEPEPKAEEPKTEPKADAKKEHVIELIANALANGLTELAKPIEVKIGKSVKTINKISLNDGKVFFDVPSETDPQGHKEIAATAVCISKAACIEVFNNLKAAKVEAPKPEPKDVQPINDKERYTRNTAEAIVTTMNNKNVQSVTFDDAIKVEVTRPKDGAKMECEVTGLRRTTKGDVMICLHREKDNKDFAYKLIESAVIFDIEALRTIGKQINEGCAKKKNANAIIEKMPSVA